MLKSGSDSKKKKEEQTSKSNLSVTNEWNTPFHLMVLDKMHRLD